ncbi:MAG: hypothetical protein LBD80_05475 [Tannerella sp.]|jgi:hypothetical protein|nr:hypothetical protein [Tannerella sp.]
MKLLVLAIILFSLYLIYRLSFPKQAGKPREDEPAPKEPPDEYEAVPKSRFVCPDRGQPQPTPATTLKSENQTENALTFATGNEKTNAVIPPEELGEVFGEDVNPDELDIEPDANETDNENELDAEEEAEEIRGSAGEIKGYAEGFTYDELATAIHETDKPEAMTKATVETLCDLSQTDMFEKLVSGDAGRGSRIAAVLDHSEQSLASQDENAADDKDNEYKNFDIGQFLS